jgi:hypothetical protein
MNEQKDSQTVQEAPALLEVALGEVSGSSVLGDSANPTCLKERSAATCV